MLISKFFTGNTPISTNLSKTLSLTQESFGLAFPANIMEDLCTFNPQKALKEKQEFYFLDFY
jgi:hypothetical protein